MHFSPGSYTPSGCRVNASRVQTAEAYFFATCAHARSFRDQNFFWLNKSAAMAFAFGFPQDVTDLIYSMRDWRWEMVRNGGKTPSARCFDATPMSCLYVDDQPRVWTYGLPHVGIESDEEDEDYGQIYNTDHSVGFLNDVVIRIHDEEASNFRALVLREQGRKPASFQRLQYRVDRHLDEMWYQCEPCASVR